MEAVILVQVGCVAKGHLHRTDSVFVAFVGPRVGPKFCHPSASRVIRGPGVQDFVAELEREE